MSTINSEKIKFKKTIAITDDHYLFRKGLISVLKPYKDLDVLFEAENGKDLLEKLKSQQPQIIFLDIEMPVMNGIDTTMAIRKLYPDIKIIILTAYYEKELAFKLIEKGVNSFMSKNSTTEELITAIDKVISNNYHFDTSITNTMAKGISWVQKKYIEGNLPKLSSRELEVVRLICKEYTNKEIASILCLSPRTVDTYRESIFTKTGAKNIAGIALYAIQNKIVEAYY